MPSSTPAHICAGLLKIYNLIFFFFVCALDRRGTIKKSVFAVNISVMHLLVKGHVHVITSLVLCGLNGYHPLIKSPHQESNLSLDAFWHLPKLISVSYFLLQPWKGKPSNQLINFSLKIHDFFILLSKICCYPEAFMPMVYFMSLSVMFSAPFQPRQYYFLLEILRTQG